jgi:hypothetical protein
MKNCICYTVILICCFSAEGYSQLVQEVKSDSSLQEKTKKGASGKLFTTLQHQLKPKLDSVTISASVSSYGTRSIGSAAIIHSKANMILGGMFMKVASYQLSNNNLNPFTFSDYDLEVDFDKQHSVQKITRIASATAENLDYKKLIAARQSAAEDLGVLTSKLVSIWSSKYAGLTQLNKHEINDVSILEDSKILQQLQNLHSADSTVQDVIKEIEKRRQNILTADKELARYVSLKEPSIKDIKGAFLKKINLGSFFEKGKSNFLQQGQILRGSGIVIGSKLPVKIFAGTNINQLYDGIWMGNPPGQFVNTKDFSGEVELPQIEKLGNVDVSLNNSTVSSTPGSSFLNLVRSVTSVSINKHFQEPFINGYVRVNGNLHTARSNAGIKGLSEKGTLSSFDYEVGVNRNFSRIQLNTDVVVKGMLGDAATTSYLYYDRPVFGIDAGIQKIWPQASINARFSDSKFSYGQNNTLKNRNTFIQAYYFANERNTLNVFFNHSQSSLIWDKASIRNISTSSINLAHILNWKKNAVGYNLNTRVAYSGYSQGENQSNSFVDLSNSASIMFRDAFGIQTNLQFASTQDYVSFFAPRRKIYSSAGLLLSNQKYFAGFVFETSQKYYSQYGIRQRLQLRRLANCIDINLELDIRHNTSFEMQSLYRNGILVWGNIHFNYEINKK